MPLSIEQIRAARATLPKREVETPDLGGSVFARALTLREVKEIQDLQAKPSVKPVDVTRKVVELAACNEDGSALFVGEDKGLIDSLTWGTVQAVADAAMALSGLRTEGQVQGQDPDEDARKN